MHTFDNGSKWDAINKWWSIPYTPGIHKNIEAKCAELGWKIEIVSQKDTVIKRKPLKKEEQEYYKTCPQEMIDKLILLRYSKQTMKNYMSAFEGFINYHSRKDVKTLGSAEIKEYLMYLINERKVSSSLQNIVINAIKFYIEKVCGGTASITQ